MTSIRDEADSVRLAAASTSTCTPATVLLLTSLLLPPTVNATTSKISTSKPMSKSDPKSSSIASQEVLRSTKSTKSRNNGAKQSVIELSPKEKGVLATEIINATLKALGTPVKASMPIRHRPSSQDLMKESARRTLRRSNSLPQSPLQPRSLNRVSSSPVVATRPSRASSSASMSTSGPRATAECARVAFSCLRTLQASKSSCMSDLPPFQLESGMSALIGKLVTLGLDDLAVKELRILKRRLESTGNTEPGSKIRGASATQSSSTATKNIVELIDFQHPPKSGPGLNLAISAQLHALRLLASSKKPILIDAALPVLHRENPGSPTQLLLRAAKESSTQAAKIAKQLDILSQLLLSLCPSLSTSDDSAALTIKLNPCPEIALQLQTLAFQNRILWWNLIGHKGDVEKGVLEPFSKCLGAFARRSQCNPTATYDYAFNTFHKIQETTSSYDKNQSRTITSTAAIIYKIMGSLAQDAQCYDSAIEWTEKVQSSYDKSTSETRKCSTAASLLAMKLMISSYDSKVEELLMSVLECIGGPLRGASAELDELLTEVSHARRAAISLLSKGRSGSCSSPTQSDPNGVRQMCESLVLQCPRFTLRFLGPSPGPEAATKVIVRYEQRRQSIIKSAFNTIDSTLYVIKNLQSGGGVSWALIDSSLQDCLTLLEAVGIDSIGLTDEKNGAVSYFVRISNLYYAQHLNMRRESEGPKDLQFLRPLRRSIDCIRNRPSSEKAASIMLSKLERIADIYRSIGRLDEARESLVFLREELIKNSTLTKVARAAGSKPLRSAWDHDEETAMLARANALILKIELKLRSKNTDLPHSEAHWSIEEKGVVLEHCLSVLSNSTQEALTIKRSIFKQLFDIYEPKLFPIRRLRVTIQLLKLDPDQRRDYAVDVKKTLTISGLESVVMESRDSALYCFLPSLKALAATILELQEDHPRVELLKPYLATWCSIVDKCKDEEAMISKIDSVPELINHLHSIADFLHMKGSCSIRIAVLRMIASINEVSRQYLSLDDLVLSYNALALQYLELGYSANAGLALDKAQTLASHNKVCLETSLRVQLSYAQYLLAIGNSNKCEEALLCAQSIASQAFATPSALKLSSLSSNRISLKQLLADTYLVYSLLALERGAPRIALRHAKRSLRLNRFAWSTLTSEARSREPSPEESRIECLNEDVAKFSISTNMTQIVSDSNKAPLGPFLWASVSPLFQSLQHLSSLYAHHGMFRETIYYAVQAHQLVEMTNSLPYITTALVTKASTWLSAGAFDQASELLTEAREIDVSSGERYTSIMLNLHFGKLHGLLGSRDIEQASYDNAYTALKELTDAKYISNLDRIIDPTVSLEEGMSRLAIKPKRTVIQKAATGNRPQARKAVASGNAPVEVLSSTTDECVQLSSLRGLLLRQKANALMLWNKCDESLAVLREADNCSRTRSDSVNQHIEFAKHLLFQAAEQMTTDPVYSSLQDSTISLPAIVCSTKALIPAVNASERIPGVRPSPPKRNAAISTTRERTRAKSPSVVGFYEKLRQAQEHLSEAQSSANQVSSTSIVHKLSSLQSAVTILLSAAGPSKGKTIALPNFAAASLELARNLATQRERKAILDDPEASSKGEDLLEWPPLIVSDYRQSPNVFSSEAVRFQKDYIDIIPEAWTAISISLSASQDELCVTKFQAGNGPFVLRLPLGRNNSRDVDEQVFDFKQGKTELREIIAAANYTSHSARDLKGREAKVAWWEERGELDARLKELLDNIENVWLGGFKGIFSQHKRRPDLLARFQKSFQMILDKHLPSRQNMSKKSKSPRICLDPRIWELFIGLGNTTQEECDFDEPLTDLLYFVVDVLQFHGEHNALDEIDFDSIVIETLDALRSYHGAVLSSSIGDQQNDRHTILILDKALHAFPWESLPCMDGLAVSRLPSLSCLKDRLLEQQCGGDSDLPKGHHIDRKNGAYILNPGSDLKSTQTTFEGALQSLKEWTGIVKREPSESEFKENLESRDLLLYFGHGSGAQYIRSKAIKRLENCAVTILMGCSSGALNDAGEFEPYGPPIDYMLAGCPSLVATLWDVTDQDVDRFAKSTFEHWGLFKTRAKHEEQVTKAKGKKKAVEVPVIEEKVSLVEAVAKGRKACNFRYLTAAAVCVYGIPVYLK